MKRPRLSGVFSLSAQWRPYWRMIYEAAREACFTSGLDHEGVKNLSLHRDEFTARMTKVIQDLSFSQRFEEEEISSDCRYVSGYKKPRNITEQVEIIRSIFPGLGFANEKIIKQIHPKRAEGWFAYPRWELIAPVYSQACEKVLLEIKKILSHKFYNDLIDELRPDDFGNPRIILNERTRVKLARIGDQQKGYDILVFPAQFGLLHRGRSCRRVIEVFREKEFGLGLFHISIMLITHPNRLMSREDLWLDCIDQYYPLCDSALRTPCFHMSGLNGDVLNLDSDPIDEVNNFSSSASGYAL